MMPRIRVFRVPVPRGEATAEFTPQVLPAKPPEGNRLLVNEGAKCHRTHDGEDHSKDRQQQNPGPAL